MTKFSFLTLAGLWLLAPHAQAKLNQNKIQRQKIYEDVPKNFGYLHLLTFEQFQALYDTQKLAYIKELRSFVQEQEARDVRRNVAGGFSRILRDLLAQMSLETSAMAQDTHSDPNDPSQNPPPPRRRRRQLDQQAPARAASMNNDSAALSQVLGVKAAAPVAAVPPTVSVAVPTTGASGSQPQTQSSAQDQAQGQPQPQEQTAASAPAETSSTDDHSHWADDTSGCNFGKIGPNQAKRERDFGAKCLIGGNMVCLTARPGEDKFRCTADRLDFKGFSKSKGCPDNTYFCAPPLYMKADGGPLCVPKGTNGRDTTSSHCEDDKDAATPAQIAKFMEQDKTGNARNSYNDMVKNLSEYCGHVQQKHDHFDYGDCIAFNNRLNSIAHPASVEAKTGKPTCDSKAKLFGEKDIQVQLSQNDKGLYVIKGVAGTTKGKNWIVTKCDDSGKVSPSTHNLEFSTVRGVPQINGQPDGTDDPRTTCLAHVSSNTVVETVRFAHADSNENRCDLQYQAFQFGAMDANKFCQKASGCEVLVGRNRMLASDAGAEFEPNGAACGSGKGMQKAQVVKNPNVVGYSYQDSNGRQEIFFNPKLSDDDKEKCWGRYITNLQTAPADGSASGESPKPAEERPLKHGNGEDFSR